MRSILISSFILGSGSLILSTSILLREYFIKIHYCELINYNLVFRYLYIQTHTIQQCSPADNDDGVFIQSRFQQFY